VALTHFTLRIVLTFAHKGAGGKLNKSARKILKNFDSGSLELFFRQTDTSHEGYFLTFALTGIIDYVWGKLSHSARSGWLVFQMDRQKEGRKHIKELGGN